MVDEHARGEDEVANVRTHDEPIDWRALVPAAEAIPGVHRRSRLRARKGRGGWIVAGVVAVLAVAAGLVAVRWSGSTGSGSSAVDARPAAMTCSGAPNTPGGRDPWGGCWPAAWNTGYPHGLRGDVRRPVTLTPYTGPCDIREDHVVIEAKLVTCPGMLVYGRDLVIRNSKVNGLVNTNSPTASMRLEDTEVDGLTTQSQAVGVTDVTLLRVDVHNNQHGVHCYGRCVVRDSYVHDQYAAGKGLGWHQNGFITNGGTDMQVVHTTLGCRGGCTSPLTLIPDADISNVVLDRNLVLASPDSGYCINAGSDHRVKPGDLDHIVVTDNVFQKGRNGKCAVYGVVGGWDAATSRNGNVWRGNVMDDGTSLAAA
jgi:hypothetical protein